ncbi:MAG TPA: sugar phosphate nucleotidyltransferase [Vicinamibacteria bacterium]|nr:sugar phosphate nucleotidyltransferase [Vicinamibacteria bacterium]
MKTRDGRGGSSGPWAIILAGGEGERTRPFIERWLGYHKPKQYCTFAGNRSLFQQTVDRADALSRPGRRIAVVAREHALEARAQLGDRHPGILLAQPSNRGTAPGILLALARVQAEDPNGIVIIYPSDHFVLPEDEFLATVRSAVAAAERHADRLVIVGVEPEGPELDYGWVQPGRRLDLEEADLYEVSAFVEKPSAERSAAILALGGLWNSMVLVGRVATFWSLAWRQIPEIMPFYTLLREAVGRPAEAETLNFIYEMMPGRDFSRHVLQKAPGELAVLPLRDVLWSDWGRPERIADTLRAIGAQPAFSEEHLLVS